MTTVFPLPSPTLPAFTTLLLKGPYHASAPIHLCLTHLASRPGSRAVLLTPSRDNFVAALRDLNDDWLNECGGYGTVSEVLSRVDVLSVSFFVVLCTLCGTYKLSASHSATRKPRCMPRWLSRCSGIHGPRRHPLS